MATVKELKGMDFAKGLLSKYGWKEGQGLGRAENGITEALKPQLKFDKTGMGHDAADTFTSRWWEKAFNSAADNINVTKTEDGHVTVTTADVFEISTQRVSEKRRKHMLYNNFLRTSTLTKEGAVVAVEKDPSAEALDDERQVVVTKLSDEELFAACGGRTAHKGARHGLGLNGKLARIEEQERKLLETLAANAAEVAATSSETEEKKKKKKRKGISREVEKEAENESVEPLASDAVKTKRNKKCAEIESVDSSELTVVTSKRSKKHKELDSAKSLEPEDVRTKRSKKCAELESVESSEPEVVKSKRRKKRTVLDSVESLESEAVAPKKRERKKTTAITDGPLDCVGGESASHEIENTTEDKDSVKKRKKSKRKLESID